MLEFQIVFTGSKFSCAGLSDFPLLMRRGDMGGLSQIAGRSEDMAAIVCSIAASDFACGRDTGPRPRGMPSAPSRGADVVMVRRAIWSLAAVAAWAERARWRRVARWGLRLLAVGLGPGNSSPAHPRRRGVYERMTSECWMG
jgi:hypothetical protein